MAKAVKLVLAACMKSADGWLCAVIVPIHGLQHLSQVSIFRLVHLQAPQGVRRAHQELASLMVKRNELAAALAGGGDAPLPPMLRDPSPWGCGRCYMVNACSVAHKVRLGDYGNDRSATRPRQNTRSTTVARKLGPILC